MINNSFFEDFITKLVIYSYKIEENNWDVDRHGPNEVLDINLLSGYLKYVLNNREDLENFFGILGDPESAELLKAVMLYRSLGYKHVKIPINKELMSNKNIAKANSYLTGEITPDKPGGLKEFLVPFMNEEINLNAKVSSVIYTYLVKQYYFQRNNFFIMPVYGDYAIDAGACIGDTSLGFSTSVGKAGKVFTFEVVPEYIEICKENFKKNPDLSENIELFEYALSDVPYNEIEIELLGPGSRELKNKNSPFPSVKVKTQTIDNLVKEKMLEKIDFIKMDIEGAEIPALIGASETIKKFKPKLAISAYHKIDDFVNISKLIKSLVPEYKVFIDHYSIHSEETVIYATVEDEYSYDEKYNEAYDCFQKNDFKRAEYLLRKMGSLFIDDKKINILLYKTLMNLKEFNEATDILSNFVENGENNPEMINDLIICLHEIGEDSIADSLSKMNSI
jgi:FkbM family methyltransferase